MLLLLRFQPPELSLAIPLLLYPRPKMLYNHPMVRLTLRLPETLHNQLATLAGAEAVSLNQYIVYALTRQVPLAYTVQPIAETEINEQKAAYSALLQSLGTAIFGEVEQALAGRDKVKPEKGLTPEVVKALKRRATRRPARGHDRHATSNAR